jgi:hypothetical protein
MAEPLFLPSSGIGSSPESLSRQPFPSCFLGSAPGTLSCLLLAPSLVLPATSLRDSPRCIFLYRVCSSLILSLPPPRVLARSLFAPVPVCPPSHPRVRFSCRFYTEIKHPGLWIAFYYCVLFSYFCFFMKNKYICWVVKRKLIFRLLFLCLPGASRLFLSGIFRKG